MGKWVTNPGDQRIPHQKRLSHIVLRQRIAPAQVQRESGPTFIYNYCTA